MRAVVTGSGGFIGSHLVRLLESKGWEVGHVDDYSTHDNMPSGVSIVSAQDLTSGDFPLLDAVFHLAGKVGPTGVLRWAGEITRDTVDSAHAAAGWAMDSQCPLIDISTSEIYGDPTGPNSEMTPRTFQTGHSPRMEYAIAKLAAETMLLNTEGLDVRIIRPFNVAGPGQRVDGGFVLPRFVSQAINGESLTVYMPGTQRRAFTHVEDIVNGIWLAYETGKTKSAYNIGNPANECSIVQLAQEVIDIVGSGYISLVDPIELHGKLFKEAADKVPDSSKAMIELGWVPKYDRPAIIRDVVDFWKNKG